MKEIILSICQLGYRRDSEKRISLMHHGAEDKPDEIPFYIQRTGSRLKRSQRLPSEWKGQFFRWPFDLGKGAIDPAEKNEMSETEFPLYKGWLKKQETRWGTIWQGDFSDFTEPGIYQIETQYQATVPFEISDDIYSRVINSYLNYMFGQRSGMEIPGVRKAEHLDDGILDISGEQIDASGGWYDAGDFRKWMALTQVNMEPLSMVASCGISEYEQRAKDEIRWGNRFFHAMINDEGRVYEDVGGGDLKEGIDYEKDWWYENHPGCNCTNSGNRTTDNIPGSGDERTVRTTYNPLVQFQFVYYQMMVSGRFPGAYGEKCRELAMKAWEYGKRNDRDDRTLFVAARLMAATEVFRHDPQVVGKEELTRYIQDLLARQNQDKEGISGYFEEKNRADGFRSIIYTTYPAIALLNVLQLSDKVGVPGDIESALTAYIEEYLLADAASNPFSVTPYGVYHDPLYPDAQLFRPAGEGKGIRTFMHPVNSQEIIHGTTSNTMAAAALLIAAARYFRRDDWILPAERLIQWGMGHNMHGLSLFKGIGYRHPVAFSGVHVQVPEMGYIGYIGTPDDLPYLETSNWLEWSTQEVWDVPFAFVSIAAVHMLNSKSGK